MSWEELFMAIKDIAPDASLQMRKPGDWYIDGSSVSVAGDGCLVGEYGNGQTPETAVQEHWRKWTLLLPENRHLKDHNEVCWRWTGFRWRDVTKEVEAGLWIAGR